MGFREGLEAFLLIAITLKYITSINQGHLKNKVIQGSVAGLIISVILGLLLSQFAEYLGGVSSLTKLWESVASLVALLLVSVFIVWMIRHGSHMSQYIKDQVGQSVSQTLCFGFHLSLLRVKALRLLSFHLQANIHLKLLVWELYRL